MKCKHVFEGKLCGADLEPSAKFCSTCGAVTKDEVNSALCPNCANTVKPADKFCSKCGEKIDPNLFVQKQYSCKGVHEGQVCGANLSIDDKFCSVCGYATESRDERKVSEKLKPKTGVGDTTKETGHRSGRSSKSDERKVSEKLKPKTGVGDTAKETGHRSGRSSKSEKTDDKTVKGKQETDTAHEIDQRSSRSSKSKKTEDKTVRGKQKIDTIHEFEKRSSRSSKSGEKNDGRVSKNTTHPSKAETVDKDKSFTANSQSDISSQSDVQLSSSDDSHSDVSNKNKKTKQSHGMQSLKKKQSQKVTESDPMKEKLNSESDTGDERVHSDHQSDKRTQKLNDGKDLAQEGATSNDVKKKRKHKGRNKKPTQTNDQTTIVDTKQNEGKRKNKNKAKGQEKENENTVNTVNMRVFDAEDPNEEENAHTEGKSDEKHLKSNTDKDKDLYERISDSEDSNKEDTMQTEDNSDEMHHTSEDDKDTTQLRISDAVDSKEEDIMQTEDNSDEMHHTSEDDKDISQLSISDSKNSNGGDITLNQREPDKMHRTSDDDQDKAPLIISDSENSNGEDNVHIEDTSDKMHHISDEDEEKVQQRISDLDNSNGDDNVHIEGKPDKIHYTSDEYANVGQKMKSDFKDESREDNVHIDEISVEKQSRSEDYKETVKEIKSDTHISTAEIYVHRELKSDNKPQNSDEEYESTEEEMAGNGTGKETAHTKRKSVNEQDNSENDKEILTTEEPCKEQKQNIRRSERLKLSNNDGEKSENHYLKGTASLFDGPIIKKSNKHQDHKTTEQKPVKQSRQKNVKHKEEAKRPPKGHVESAYSETIEVSFHVVISPSMRQSGGTMAIQFENNPERYYGVKKRELPDLDPGYAEFEFKILFKRNQNITIVRYAYCVVHPEGEVREYIPNNQLRKVNIQSNAEHEIVHQYDGVARSKQDREKKRWRITKLFISLAGIETTDSYTDILKNDSQIAISTFLPNLMIFESNASAQIGDHMLVTVRKIMADTRTHYMYPKTSWSSETDFKTQTRKVLQQYVDKCLAKLVEYTNRRKEDQILHVSCAATILLLQYEHQLFFNPEQIADLCDLFLPLLTKNQDRCTDFEIVKHHFQMNSVTLTSALLQIMKGIADKGKDASWLKCIPLYHFLGGQCQPFQPVPPNVNHSDFVPTWWGIADFKKELTHFQRSEWNSAPNEVIEVLEPYFDIDFLLPRVVMASMNLTRILEMDFSKIRPEITLAVFSCFIKSSSMSQKSIQEFIGLFYKMESIMPILNERYQSDEDAKRSFSIAKDLMKICMTTGYGVPEPEITDLCIALSGVVFHSINCLQKAVDRSFIEEDLSYFHKLKEWICKRLLNCQNIDLLSTLQSWNNALRVSIPDGWLKSEYLKSVNDSLHIFLNELTLIQEEQLITVYLHAFEVFDDTLKNILTKYTYQAIQKRKSVEIRAEDYENYRKILPSVFERNLDYENLKDGHQCLMYSLTWPPFATFLEMFNDQQFFVSLNENCQKWIRKFIDVLKAVCDGICDGTVSVNDLRFILKNLENFRSVVRQLNEVTINMDNFQSIIETRKKEIEKYDEVADNVEKLNRVCGRYLANLDILEERHTNQDSMDPVKLNDICKIQSEGKINSTTYEPTIVAFEIPETLLSVLPLLISCNNSLLFKKIWTKTGTMLMTNKKRRLTIEEVFTEIWEPSYERWMSLQEKLIKGRIQLSEYDEYFQNTQIEELRTECNLLGEKNGNTDWIEQRLTELEQFKFIHRCSSAAKLIHEIVSVYGITGNFKDIQNVQELAENTEAFFAKADATSEVYRALSSIDYLHEDCLKAFIECKELIEWIRETMKSGLKDLKVFVELASISAGEGDLEIDKVNRLQSATSGYAPLIFLNTEETIDAKILLTKCHEVWENLSENKELPTKLRATNLQLEWFKLITQTHGAVEVTSLFQAEEINSNGIYVIGNHSKCGNSKKPTLAEVLALKVYDMKGKPKVGQAKEKSYNYDQLHDLQSRLMLVAGKGKAGHGKGTDEKGKKKNRTRERRY